jgi:hypothetical protein
LRYISSISPTLGPNSARSNQPIPIATLGARSLVPVGRRPRGVRGRHGPVCQLRPAPPPAVGRIVSRCRAARLAWLPVFNRR